MAFPPELFLIGAQKAGTTYLASLLDQHPDISVSKPKEPHYFTQNREKGVGWYRACFPAPDQHKLFVDASPSYSLAPVHDWTTLIEGRSESRFAGVPAGIARVSPSARFVYILRDPVRRIYSAYWHDVRHNQERRSLEKALEEEVSYINGSDYLGQISYFSQTFPIGRFLFLRFEDLQNDPATVVEACTRFLDLPSLQSIEPDIGHNQGYQPGLFMKLLANARNGVPGLRNAESLVWQAVPHSLKRRIKSRLTKPLPPMDIAVHNQLVRRFAPMTKPLEELTGLNLGVWRLRDPG